MRHWLRMHEATDKVRLRPAARSVLLVLLARNKEIPHLQRIFYGYGGVRDAKHRAWLEERKQKGLPPPRPGLAEKTRMCRSSMIRAIRDLVADEWLKATRGGGRGTGGDGRANEYELGAAWGLPAADQLQAQQQLVREESAPDVDWSEKTPEEREAARRRFRAAVDAGLARDGP